MVMLRRFRASDMTLSSVRHISVNTRTKDPSAIIHTLRRCPWCTGHSRLFQPLIITQQPLRSLGTTSNQRFRLLAGLSNLDNLLQLVLANLSCRQNKLPSSSNRLRLLQLRNLRVTSCDKLRLVRCVLALLATLLTFLALSFLFLGLALVLETAQGLTDGSCGLASLFV